MIVRDIVDYETNRFIFMGWKVSPYKCKKCNCISATLKDRYNTEVEIEYCFECKERLNIDK